jgi:hypothetical protein
MDFSNITLEKEFQYIKVLYNKLLSAKSSSDVDIIFNKYLKEEFFLLWRENPYIFHEIDSRLSLEYLMDF